MIKLGDNKGMKYEGSHFIIVDGSMKKVIRDFIPVSNEADLINIYPFSNPQNDQNLFSYGFDNNIYEITNNIETPKFLIDFGRNQLKKDDIVKGQKHVISILMASNYAGYIHNLINLDNTIYFNFLYNKETYLFGFEKKTGKSRLINNVIQNKMVGYSNQIVTTYNDFIILRGNSSDIFNAKNELNSTEPKRFGKFTDFQKLQKNTKIDDNPCLVLMKLKI